MTKFQERLKSILAGKFELSKEEKEKEDIIWHNRVVYCWGIDTEAEPTESESAAKKKFKEYQRQYYIEHRKPSTKTIDMSERGIKARASMAKLRNRMCLYEGERVKYGTLQARLHNKLGYSWPDAKIIADDCILKETE